MVTLITDNSKMADAPAPAASAALPDFPRPSSLERLRGLFMRSEPLRGYSLLSPTMVLMLIALAAPLVMLITMSFWTQDYLDFNKGFHLDNYQKFFEKKLYWALLLKSMRISATVTLVTVLLAYPMAYFMMDRPQVQVMAPRTRST